MIALYIIGTWFLWNASETLRLPSETITQREDQWHVALKAVIAGFIFLATAELINYHS